MDSGCPEEFEWTEKTETKDQIRVMSKFRFQAKVRKAVREKAFDDLVQLKNTHKKVKHINFTEFKMQSYLKSELWGKILVPFKK